MVYTANIMKRIAEIGFLAYDQGRLADAEIIFAGIGAFAEKASEKSAGNLGMAVTKIAAGDFETGIKLLTEELVAVDYANLEAAILMVYALRQDNRYREAETLVSKMEANPEFEGSLAQEVLVAMEA